MTIELKPPPKRAPKRLRTTEDLRSLQRLMLHTLVRPLTSEDRLQAQWTDGRPMAEVAAEFIKPNNRLSAFDRLELYNRMYWFRLIDCVYEDNPGLRALLGEERFSELVRAFITKYPSRSFSLRNLCSRLEQFLRQEPQWSAPHLALACELARFEWAQTVAFDGEARAVVTAEEIAQTPPGRLRLALQPYLTLLALEHAVDDYMIAVKKRESLRSEASHAADAAKPRTTRARKIDPPRRERIWLAVHRVNNLIYYKRLDAPAFRILETLRDGRTLSQAINGAVEQGVTPTQVRAWFSTWMELGWFSRR